MGWGGKQVKRQGAPIYLFIPPNNYDGKGLGLGQGHSWESGMQVSSCTQEPAALSIAPPPRFYTGGLLEPGTSN